MTMRIPSAPVDSLFSSRRCAPRTSDETLVWRMLWCLSMSWSMCAISTEEASESHGSAGTGGYSGRAARTAAHRPRTRLNFTRLILRYETPPCSASFQLSGLEVHLYYRKQLRQRIMPHQLAIGRGDEERCGRDVPRAYALPVGAGVPESQHQLRGLLEPHVKARVEGHVKLPANRGAEPVRVLAGTGTFPPRKPTATSQHPQGHQQGNHDTQSPHIGPPLASSRPQTGTAPASPMTQSCERSTTTRRSRVPAREPIPELTCARCQDPFRGVSNT